MHSKINFYAAALLITLIGSGASMFIVHVASTESFGGLTLETAKDTKP